MYIYHAINTTTPLFNLVFLVENSFSRKRFTLGYNADQQQTQIHIQISEVKIEQVHKFKYLEATIDDTGNQETVITERIEKANKLDYAIRTNFINTNTKRFLEL